ncbi:MAG: hypothetical protein J5483_06805 [Lachnospiraceae bacterium]|nr:hypothetical protein [Lachnospiraceae bacterium]
MNNSVERIFAEGNTIRLAEEAEPVRIRLPRERTERQRQASRKVSRQKKMISVFLTGIAAVLLVALCIAMLTIAGENNGLKTEISRLESQVSELKSQNDSRQYDLNSAVDLNYVVKVATEELGMVRSTSGQIRTYSTAESEYIQQVAEIPTE